MLFCLSRGTMYYRIFILLFGLLGCPMGVSQEPPIISSSLPATTSAPIVAALSLPAVKVEPVPLPIPVEFQKGVSLRIYTESKNRTYEQMLDEIAALGADHVELIVLWWQSSLRSNQIEPSSRFTITDKRLLAVVAYAHKIGLKVFLYPCIDIYNHGGWRGEVAPKDWEEWWRSYQRFIMHYAKLSQQSGVELFAVGSEMSSAEAMHDHWVSLIGEVRKVFTGSLVYAANWDKYQSISFEEHVDYIGIDAYFPLSARVDPTYEELVLAWKSVQKEILAWQRKSGRPFLFTEIGYASQDGANQQPWVYSAAPPVDLEEQLLCYQAFREVWSMEPSLHGIYIWTWSKPGGKSDKSYTPRGKLAEEELRKWFSVGGAFGE
jgi:hypothetical protein